MEYKELYISIYVCMYVYSGVSNTDSVRQDALA